MFCAALRCVAFRCCFLLLIVVVVVFSLAKSAQFFLSRMPLTGMMRSDAWPGRMCAKERAPCDSLRCLRVDIIWRMLFSKQNMLTCQYFLLLHSSLLTHLSLSLSSASSEHAIFLSLFTSIDTQTTDTHTHTCNQKRTLSKSKQH